MKQIILNIKYIISEENFNSDSFQEFLNHIQSGDMKKEMHEGDFFQDIKISYQVDDLD